MSTRPSEPHDCRTFDPACFRCDLARDEATHPSSTCDDCGSTGPVAVYEEGPGQAYKQVLCADCRRSYATWPTPTTGGLVGGSSTSQRPYRQPEQVVFEALLVGMPLRRSPLELAQGVLAALNAAGYTLLATAPSDTTDYSDLFDYSDDDADGNDQ